ncbi:MAG TPA: Qat anti-phage system TatD family nuclease QatD [Puia sp.]|nr:Qat anti-phage system TatD family nuclease QatD [Puia sp.]
MSALIDTHCHLDLFKDIQSLKEAEAQLGIKTISVTNAPSFFQPNCQLFNNSKNIRVALGFHPQLVEQYKGELGLFKSFVEKARYIGEIGLDGSKDLKNTYHEQMRILKEVLISVRSHGRKIITVHSRNAATETIEIFQQHLKGSNNIVIFHWFSGSLIEVREAISSGFYFSINHKMVVTEKGKEIIKKIPAEYLLTETDAPFTFSGSINNRIESLNSTINGISAITNKGAAEVRAKVFENFRRVIS